MEDVPSEDEAHVVVPGDERVAEHLSVWLLILLVVAHSRMREDVHGLLVSVLHTMLDQSDRHREVPRCLIATAEKDGNVEERVVVHLLSHFKEAELALLVGLVALPEQLDDVFHGIPLRLCVAHLRSTLEERNSESFVYFPSRPRRRSSALRRS